MICSGLPAAVSDIFDGAPQNVHAWDGMLTPAQVDPVQPVPSQTSGASRGADE